VEGLKELNLVAMELGEPDVSGRRKPMPVKGSEFVIDVDTVIVAIGRMQTQSYKK
jgi:glutamate synthase (NADPH/NADH) small chain